MALFFGYERFFRRILLFFRFFQLFCDENRSQPQFFATIHEFYCHSHPLLHLAVLFPWFRTIPLASIATHVPLSVRKSDLCTVFAPFLPRKGQNYGWNHLKTMHNFVFEPFFRNFLPIAHWWLLTVPSITRLPDYPIARLPIRIFNAFMRRPLLKHRAGVNSLVQPVEPHHGQPVR